MTTLGYTPFGTARRSWYQTGVRHCARPTASGSPGNSITVSCGRWRLHWNRPEPSDRREVVRQRQSDHKEGALWYSNTDIRNYPIQSLFEIKPEWNDYLGSIRTRLNAFTDAEKSRLINWGYVMCDLSIRSYYRPEKAPPRSLPFPEFAFSAPPVGSK